MGGTPSLPGYGQKGKGGKYLFHKTEEIRAPKSINDTQQSLMLGLGLRQLGGHRSGVCRNQSALCHLQLALLGLGIGTGRLQPAQRAIKRAALRRQLPQRGGQRSSICRKRSRRRAAGEIGD